MTQPAHRFAFLFLAPLLAFFMAAAPLFAANRERIEAFLTTTGFDVALESIALSFSVCTADAGHRPGRVRLGLGTSDG